MSSPRVSIFEKKCLSNLPGEIYKKLNNHLPAQQLVKKHNLTVVTPAVSRDNTI